MQNPNQMRGHGHGMYKSAPHGGNSEASGEYPWANQSQYGYYNVRQNGDGRYQNPVETYDSPYPATGVKTWFDFYDACYLKGFIFGAGATLLITNEKVQKTLIKGTVKLWSFVQGGVEEVKEQFRDVKAEMTQEP